MEMLSTIIHESLLSDHMLSLKKASFLHFLAILILKTGLRTKQHTLWNTWQTIFSSCKWGRIFIKAAKRLYRKIGCGPSDALIPVPGFRILQWPARTCWAIKTAKYKRNPPQKTSDSIFVKTPFLMDSCTCKVESISSFEYFNIQQKRGPKTQKHTVSWSSFHKLGYIACHPTIASHFHIS